MGFVEEYVELTMLVMQKPSVGFVRPSLTYGPNGWFFNGSQFGNNEQAAKQARQQYWENDSSIHPEWDEKEPLVLDLDLPTE